MTVTSDQQRDLLMETLYERYGRPLEAEHRGEFVAITEGGETVLGATLLAVVQRAKALYGSGTYVFRIGGKVIGRWR